MRISRLIAVVAAAPFAALMPAQSVAAIPAMTVPSSSIDMDLVGPAGPTTLAAINGAGAPAPANIANITLLPTTVATGIYNTNPTEGRALGLLGGGLALMDPPSGVFDSFDARIDLGQPSTEIGMCIADWVSTMTLDFYNSGALLTSFTTAAYSTAAPKFFQMTGGTFDRVDVRASSTVGNWVIPCLFIEIGGGGSFATVVPQGSGCGTPNSLSLAALGRPVQGAVATTFQVTTGNIPATALIHMGIVGLSRPGLPLAAVGMPGCILNASLDVLVGPDIGPFGSTFTWTGLNLPALPPDFSGFQFNVQGAILGTPQNTGFGLGALTSNGLKCTVGTM